MIDAAVLCLALNLYHEARSEPIEGQLAVALVTINRARGNPARICQEVFRPHQFSWTLKPPPITDVKQFEKMKGIAKKALSMRDFTGGADHFHADYVSPKWATNLERIGQWGRHVFYRRWKHGVIAQ